MIQYSPSLALESLCGWVGGVFQLSILSPQSKLDRTGLRQKQAGTELGKAQPKLGLGKIVAKLYNFCQTDICTHRKSGPELKDIE